MVLPIDAIEAEVDAPGVVEIKPGQKQVRLTIRTTLRNNSDETLVLHAPSRDHEHFWHLFDDSSRELGRERGGGKGGQDPDPSSRKFRSLTLRPGGEEHATRNIRLDAKELLARPGRITLRAEIWGQSAETEFVTVVRPARLRPAKKKAAAKKAAKKKAPGKKATGKRAAKKKAGKKKAGTKKAKAKKKATPKKKAMKRAVAKKKTAAKKPAKRRVAQKKKAKKGGGKK